MGIPASVEEGTEAPRRGETFSCASLMESALKPGVSPAAYNEAVEKMATGLFESSMAEFLSLDSSVFARGDTQKGDREKISALAKFQDYAAHATNFSNRLTDFILESANPEDAIKKCRFLLNVANACLKNGDCENFMLIFGALSNSSIGVMIHHSLGMKIDETIRGNSEPLHEAIEKMKSVQLGSYRQLRVKYAELDSKRQPCIPFMTVCANDMTFAFENAGLGALTRAQVVGQMIFENHDRQTRLREIRGTSLAGALGVSEREAAPAPTKTDADRTKRAKELFPSSSQRTT
jgi:hypothetical protein